MVKKILLFLFLGIFLINFISAECSYLGSFKQGETVKLKQICDNCTYVNLTTVDNNQETFNFSILMNKNGENYYYDFSNTSYLGSYQYNVCGDKNGVVKCEVLCFDITPSGNTGSSNIVFFLFIILIIYAVALIGFFGRNIPITVLGGMAMIGLGVYTINEGLIIYRDWITNYFSYVTLGLGALLSLWAIIEWIQDTM